MANVIRAGASAGDILTDVTRTLKRATVRGAPYQDDAETFLGVVDAEAEAIDQRLSEAEDALETARAEQAHVDDVNNTWIRNLKDRLWHMIGRVSSDPIFRRTFPGGSSRYTALRPSAKPDAMELLATMLETNRHPSIADEVVQESTTELRQAATAMADINAQLDTARTKVKILRAQRTSNAQHARLQLARLKGYWKAQGLSEPDIHQMIPDRGRKVTPEEELTLEEALDADATSLAAK